MKFIEEVKSKRNFESFLIIYFLTFMISTVFSLILFDNIKDLQNEFSISLVIKSLFFIICLIFIWFFFINIHTQILITKNGITIKKFFKTKYYDFEDLNLYFERLEPSKYKDYKGLFIVKGNEVVERISSFDYSNYEELKHSLKLEENKNVRINSLDILRLMFGQVVKVSKR
ncbi:hypothetical protein [Chryseobacterium sp. YIM B08800]|uniref:hypothetical protein n=1 Tax=Chryseobacterium sp. YIM B08800 TaxID=2984136 RepID=UPI00223FC854|nr:hypothetical protein [Chryseobacterium sp. YIM B08800]